MTPRARQATFGLALHERRVDRAIHRIRKDQPQAVKDRRIDDFIAALLARSAARRR
jgi:hypothetical protein